MHAKHSHHLLLLLDLPFPPRRAPRKDAIFELAERRISKLRDLTPQCSGIQRSRKSRKVHLREAGSTDFGMATRLAFWGVGEDGLCLPPLTTKERFCQILNNFAMLLHELSNSLGHVTHSLTGSPSRMRPVADFS